MPLYIVHRAPSRQSLCGDVYPLPDVVLAGPVKVAERQVHPQLLSSTVSTLAAAITNPHQGHSAVAAAAYASSSADALAASAQNLVLESGVDATLHGLDSTTAAAQVGCRAHLLRLCSTNGLAAASSAAAKATDTQQQSQQPPGHVVGPIQNAAMHDVSAPAPSNADRDGDVDMTNGSPDPAQHPVLDDLAAQIAELTHFVELPWQLQLIGAQVPADRSAAVTCLHLLLT